MGISSLLLDWYRHNGRDLPWRESRDPYQVWISEVILQQTRIDQGMAYYHRFIGAFPDVRTLARASADDVLRHWQGLGYYSRARNLHRAARRIVEERNGVLPRNSAGWQDLPGVGPYTAAAIASIAFGERVPALDANAIRVISRLFAVDARADQAAGKRVIDRFARHLLPEGGAGDFNQAVMDFGSLVCRPADPACHSCILQPHCAAYGAGIPGEFPKLGRKRAARVRCFHYFYFFAKGDDNVNLFFVNRRTGKDIWNQLYEFPLLEAGSLLDTHQVCRHRWWTRLFSHDGSAQFVPPFHDTRHQLTHQLIHARFFLVRVGGDALEKLKTQYLCVDARAFDRLAKPRLIERLHALAETRHAVRSR